MKTIDTNLAHRWYTLFVHYADNLQSGVLLIVRLFFGWELFVSGKGHLANPEVMVKRFIEWGVPVPHLNVYVSGTTELVGGLLILFGLASRLISIPLVINFVVAYLTASRKTVVHLFFGPDRLGAIDDFTSDAAFFFLIAALIVLAFGPGKASLDYLLERTVFKKASPAPSYARAESTTSV